MTNKKSISLMTILLFSIMILSGQYSGMFSQTETEENNTGKLLKKAEEHYQNGEFTQAIEVYETIIKLLNEKKELAETKQKLIQTMLSLALTYFTIQEEQKARIQLEKLVNINPKQELDPEFYPPRFISIFNEIQKEQFGLITIVSFPENAEIMINNVKIGQTPITQYKYLKGEYTLMAKLEGYVVHTQNIVITPGQENKTEISLLNIEESKKPAILEKETQKPEKKKKKFPLLLVLGGAAAVVLTIILLSGKGNQEPETLAREFINNEPAKIYAVGGGLSLIQADGIPPDAIVEKIEYEILIHHPAMNALLITLVGTDNRTTWIVWNRQDSPTNPTQIKGLSTAFNSIEPNGIWKLLVQNNGNQPGQITKWMVKIFYHLEAE